MKIAMIGQKGIPTQFGGIERHVEELACRLGAMGHEVTVYTRAWYAAPKKRFSKGVRTVATPTVKSKHLDAIIHTFTSTLHALREDVDIIHYHAVGPSLLSWIPRLLAPRVKVIATFHCIDRKHQKWNFFARLALGLGEKAACLFPHETIAVSKTLEAYCRDRFNRDVHYIPNGITNPGRTGSDLLVKFNLKKNGYIAMVSRLVRHKGVHYLIKAFQNLEKRGQTGGLKLAIVGDSAFTDDYVAELKAAAAGNPNIVFTGYRQGAELQQLFANAYAIAHPSESEGLPIAVLEAMSYGKTVLASDIPEILEVTREHGLSFRNKDVADLERKLRSLIARPELARAKGRAAKTFVLADYHWDDVATAVSRLYTAVTAASRPVKAKIVRSVKV
jgi:glycosyltransferase involved in cell wall biosynthesis